MSPFTLRELAQVNDGLAQLYSTHDLIPLIRHSIALFRRWIPNDMTIFAVTDPAYPQVAGIFEPDYHELPTYGQQYQAFCQTHPIMLHFLKTKNYSAIRFKDVIAQRDLEKLDLYNQFFKPLKINDLMGIVCYDSQNRQMAIGSSRDARFSDRDRLRMETLRPHISCAFRNAGLLAQAGRKPFTPDTILRETKGATLIVSSTKTFGDTPAKSQPLPLSLTPREVEILSWIGQGKTNPEIAIILDISPRTVQKHVEHLFVKLNVSSRTGAAIRAIELGIINPHEAIEDHEQLVMKEAANLRAKIAPRLISA